MAREEVIIEMTFTLPEGVTAIEYRDGVSREWNYPETILDPEGEDGEEIPNPQGKLDFIKQKMAAGPIAAFEADLVKQAAQAVRDSNAAAREDFVVS